MAQLAPTMGKVEEPQYCQRGTPGKCRHGGRRVILNSILTVWHGMSTPWLPALLVKFSHSSLLPAMGETCVSGREDHELVSHVVRGGIHRFVEKLASTVKLERVASISCGKADRSYKDGNPIVRRGYVLTGRSKKDSLFAVVLSLHGGMRMFVEMLVGNVIAFETSRGVRHHPGCRIKMCATVCAELVGHSAGTQAAQFLECEQPGVSVVPCTCPAI